MTFREVKLAILKRLWDETEGLTMVEIQRFVWPMGDFLFFECFNELLYRGLVIKVRVMHAFPSLDHWRYFAANQIKTRKEAG